MSRSEDLSMGISLIHTRYDSNSPGKKRDMKGIEAVQGLDSVRANGSSVYKSCNRETWGIEGTVTVLILRLRFRFRPRPRLRLRLGLGLCRTKIIQSPTLKSRVQSRV